MKCDSCHKATDTVTSAVVDGVYYKNICMACIHGDTDISSGAASFDRRRQYEDNAADTVQPYDAAGPNKEFYRLFPEAAAKVFQPDVIEELKRKI